MARRSVGGVVTVWPSVGIVGGARLSHPVEVVVSLLIPAAASLLEVTQVCRFFKALHKRLRSRIH